MEALGSAFSCLGHGVGLFFHEESVVKLLIAFVLASVLGVERDIHGRSAGLRTHILVCIGSTLFMLIAFGVAHQFNVDPTRVAGQIVTGIGFLGAGVIIKTGVDVRGLTTAAAIWVDAAIGTAVGAGLYAEALGVTLLALFVLTILNRIENLYPKGSIWGLTLKFDSFDVTPEQVRALVGQHKVRVIYMEYSKDYQKRSMSYHIRCRVSFCRTTHAQLEQVIQRLESQFYSLSSFRWSHQ